jgi:4-amino-4-deoxy-L-arabinose transferase-like glycosyltransferase
MRNFNREGKGMNAAKRLCRWLEALNLKHIVLFLLALGVVVHLAALVLLRIHLTIAFAEMEKIARSLAENGTFANPFKIPTGPTAHHAPVYPLLLSLIFRAFGYGTAAAYAVAVMNICFAALQCALLPVLADVARIHRVVGVTAGLFGALVPFRIRREIRWETTLSALLIVVLVILTTHWWQTSRPSRSHTFLLGLAWGAGMLNSPVLLPVFLLLLLFFGVSAWMRKQRQWQLTVALAALGMAVAVSPWAIRNYRALGGFVFVRSNFGLELSISFNPEAHALFADNLSIGYPNNYYHLHHPWASEENAEQVRQIGELAYNRQCLRQGITWIRADPRRFAKLILERAVFYWFMPMETQPLKALLLIPWTLLAAAGLWLALRRHPALGSILLCLWVGYPLVYYIVQSDARYRYPIDWTFALLAVYLLTKPLWDVPGMNTRANGDRTAEAAPGSGTSTATKNAP